MRHREVSCSNDEATNPNRFDDGLSAALILTEGPASLVTEVTAGLGSEDGDGLRAQRRYEREAGLGTGQRYKAGYAGFNLHLAEHRAKLMTGIEYATLDGEHSWTASVAVRLFWGPHSRGPFPMAQVLAPDGRRSSSAPAAAGRSR